MEINFKQILMLEANRNKIGIDDNSLEIFDLYRNEIIKWNKKMNLTRIIDPLDFARKHVIDCLIFHKKLEIGKMRSLIDIGTGPGIPGIIVKIQSPHLVVDLVESNKKKTAFLRHVVNKFGFDKIEVINNRAEQTAKESKYRQSYDIATARAVASLCALSEICLPFVKIGGIFAALKGEEVDDEVRESEGAIKIMGGEISSIVGYEISESIKRKIIVVKKVKKTPDGFPRKPGTPKKHPLKWKY
ncbi:MAG: 16S rRNA (guanine(527)-N(7))-methyltransferase RsmG [Thermoanaerobacterales bacterium]|jgi:16S rRNA (guanine527-N7)-methyltransferase|nr:16S rRNA (guanine(527)-N(7))-methyltransferase RsmG [Thermoanaerobacterales bacterium]